MATREEVAASLGVVALGAACILALSACGSSGGGGGGGGGTVDTAGGSDATGGGDAAGGQDTVSPEDTAGGGDTGGGGGGSTILALKQLDAVKGCKGGGSKEPAFQSGVTIDNAVVVSPEDSINTALAGLYVQHPGGGAWSGLYLVRNKKDGGFTGLKPGDTVTVTGDLKAYYCYTQFEVKALTKGAPAVDPPKATTLDVDAIGDKAKFEDNEKYESALITVENVVVSDAGVLGSDGKGHGEIYVGKTADDKALIIAPGLSFGTTFSSYDSAAKTWKVNVDKGKAYASITGMLTFSFEKYRLVPLGDANMVAK